MALEATALGYGALRPILWHTRNAISSLRGSPVPSIFVTDTTKPAALPFGTAHPRRPLFQHPWRVLTVVVAVVVVLNLGVVILNKSDTTPQARTGLPTTIQSIQPRPGDLIRPQDTITVELDPNLTGALVLDSQEIPTNELDRLPGLGEVSFRPGPGKSLSQFAPGGHTVVVEYWPVTKPRPTNPSSYGWSFRVGA
jgi:hypothetical protein